MGGINVLLVKSWRRGLAVGAELKYPDRIKLEEISSPFMQL